MSAGTAYCPECGCEHKAPLYANHITKFPKNCTLRDYFAAQMLAGLTHQTLAEIARETRYDIDRYEAIIAALCYRQADAMLAERSKP